MLAMPRKSPTASALNYPCCRPPAELPGGVQLGRVAPGMYRDRVFTLLRTTLTSSDAAEASRAMEDLEARQLPLQVTALAVQLACTTCCSLSATATKIRIAGLCCPPKHSAANLSPRQLGTKLLAPASQALLRQLDGWLAEKGQQFIGGKEPNTTDCYLVPKLQHAVLALKDLKGWELPGAILAAKATIPFAAVHQWRCWLCSSLRRPTAGAAVSRSSVENWAHTGMLPAVCRMPCSAWSPDSHTLLYAGKAARTLPPLGCR